MIFLEIAIVLSILRLIAFVWLHYKNPKISFLKNTVSDYGAEKNSKKLYQINSVISIAMYGVVLVYLLMKIPQPAFAISLLSIAFLGSIAILFFPTDLTGSNQTATGKLHWILAIINFAALFTFMVNVQVPHSELFDGMTWIVRVAFYSFLVTLVVPKLRKKYIGLTERAFLFSVPLWFLIFCVSLL